MKVASNTAEIGAIARLRCLRGRWTLETTELVAVDRDVYRPKRRTIEGAEAIIAHLRKHDDNPDLAQGALALLRSRRDDDCCYEALGGEWLSAEVARALRATEAPSGAELSGKLAELRAELLVFRASHRALKDRVTRVERRVPRHSREGGASSSRRELQVPSAAALIASLSPLVGSDAGLAAAENALPTSEFELAGVYASHLVDRMGDDAGVILVNPRMLVELASRVLCLETSEMEAQLSSASVSEDSLAAMNELCNVIARAVTDGAGEPQLSPEHVGPCAFERLGWLVEARVTRVLGSMRGGALWLAVKN